MHIIVCTLKVRIIDNSCIILLVVVYMQAWPHKVCRSYYDNKYIWVRVSITTYKHICDEQRAPRPAIWKVVPHEWAASMNDLGSSATVMSRATCVRIIWDKQMHGRNLRKNPLFKDDTSCPLCGGEDSHIIRECSHRTCRQNTFYS